MSLSDDTRDSLTGGEEQRLEGTFYLQLISPSQGVDGPLTFPQIPSATTIKQLKEKIRNSLPMRPPDEHQRLIHRGRLLARENETLLDVFGVESLKVPEMRTIHLVLRQSALDGSDNQSTTSVRNQQEPFQARAPVPPPIMPVVPPLPDSIQHLLDEHQRAQGLTRSPTPTSRLSTPPVNLGYGEQANDFQAPFYQSHQRHPVDQQLQQSMQLLQQVERDHARNLQASQENSGHNTPPPPSFQDLIAQQQRDRAASGVQGAHAGGNSFSQAPPIPRRVTYRPPGTRTITQEYTAPNGDRYQVTLNETTTTTTVVHGNAPPLRPEPQVPSVREVQQTLQNIARSVDGNTPARPARQPFGQTNFPWNPLATAIADGGINRPASAPPLERLVPTSAQVPHQIPPQRVAMTSNPVSSAFAPTTPTVYILSSPTGPQGLLISPSENGLETFVTSRGLAQSGLNRRQPTNPQGPLEPRRRRDGRLPRQAQLQAGAGVRPAGAPAHPANPPAGLIAARILPHVWLVIRLLGFVWFFASGSTSWWRLVTVSGIAFIVFLASTGILNGVVEDVWGPIRRHLDALLPLAGPNGPQLIVPERPVPEAGALVQGQVGAAAGGAQGAQNTLPDPPHMAARLVEQRRLANRNWIWTQIRRIEHATILFVASLVPGVGERHIAARAAADELLQRAQQEANAIAARTAEVLAAIDAETDEGSNSDEATSAAADGMGGSESEGQVETATAGDTSLDTTPTTRENQNQEDRDAGARNSDPVERLIEV